MPNMSINKIRKLNNKLVIEMDACSGMKDDLRQ